MRFFLSMWSLKNRIIHMNRKTQLHRLHKFKTANCIKFKTELHQPLKLHGPHKIEPHNFQNRTCLFVLDLVKRKIVFIFFNIQQSVLANFFKCRPLKLSTKSRYSFSVWWWDSSPGLHNREYYTVTTWPWYNPCVWHNSCTEQDIFVFLSTKV